MTYVWKLVLALCFVLGASIARADGGFDATTDTSFGSGGYTVTKNANGTINVPVAWTNGTDDSLYELAETCAPAPGTYLQCNGSYAVTVWHFFVDGQVDTAFGEKGMLTLSTATVPFTAVPLTAFGFDVQDVTGHVYVGGYTLHGYQVARFNFDGTLDMVAYNGGLSDPIAPSGATPTLGTVQLMLDAKGRLYVYGGSSSGIFFARLTAAGKLDGSFGSAGYEVPALPDGCYQTAGSLSLGTSGAYAGVGACDKSHPALVLHVLEDGSLDPSFGTGGIASVTSTVLGNVRTLVLHDDGSLAVLIGATPVNNKEDMAVLKLASNGTMDASWSEEDPTYHPAKANFIPVLAQMLPQTSGELVFGGGIWENNLRVGAALTRIFGDSVFAHANRVEGDDNAPTPPNANSGSSGGAFGLFPLTLLFGAALFRRKRSS